MRQGCMMMAKLVLSVVLLSMEVILSYYLASLVTQLHIISLCYQQRGFSFTLKA